MWCKQTTVSCFLFNYIMLQQTLLFICEKVAYFAITVCNLLNYMLGVSLPG